MGTLFSSTFMFYLTIAVSTMMLFVVIFFVFFLFFFFQAEDGIRDPLVTGVQTVCSSDLRLHRNAPPSSSRDRWQARRRTAPSRCWGPRAAREAGLGTHPAAVSRNSPSRRFAREEIGRASCRERG